MDGGWGWVDQLPSRHQLAAASKLQLQADAGRQDRFDVAAIGVEDQLQHRLKAEVGVHTLGFEPWEFDSLTGSLFGASTFVLAFVLSGTLAAYSASEDLVAQFINAIESIEDINICVARLQPSLETARITSRLADLLGQLAQWLANRVGFEVIDASLADLNQILADLRLTSGDSVVDRGLPELARMRILVNRMASNRDSDFLGAAYAMLEIFLVGAVVALLLIWAERFSENMVVTCFLFTSFTYLLLLIRDLDNPFQYDGSSCVNVDQSVLNSCRQRLLAAGGATPD